MRATPTPPPRATLDAADAALAARIDSILEPAAPGVLSARVGGVRLTVLLGPEAWAHVEASAKAQLARALELPGLREAVVTPDVHTGYAVPIGFVAVSATHVYPDLVGPDPACSVSLSRYPVVDLTGLDKPARRAILDDLERRIFVTRRRGRGRSSTEPRELAFEDLVDIVLGRRRTPRTWVAAFPTIPEEADVAEIDRLVRLLRDICDDTATALRQIGSIGGGNHFLEIQEGDDGRVYAMAHFGSRGLGAQGAKRFEARVRAWDDAHDERRGSDAGEDRLLWVPADDPLGRDYLLFQKAMLEYASFNHVAVQARTAEVMCRHLGLADADAEFLGHIPHNAIEWRDGAWWHRKGATPAYDNQGIPLLVPGSMATGSYVLEPGPNADLWGASVPHGAGRRLSRGDARRHLDQAVEDRRFEDRGAMGSFRHVPLDESAGAYKDVDEVIAAVVTPGVARVVRRLHPRLVLKGE